MIYVRPSCYKLIDRAIRYIDYLIKQDADKGKFEGKEEALKLIDYELITRALYSEIESLSFGEAIVCKTYARICKDILGVKA